MKKKIKFLEETTSGYFVDKTTGENIGNKIELFYTISDENNIYYKEPVFDNVEDYEVVEEGKTIPLAEFLKIKGWFSSPFAFLLISTNLKILNIYQFPIHINNNYFCIPIDKQIANFMLDNGIADFYVIENVFGTNLLNLSTFESLNGFEILFYLSSKNLGIRKVLNELRFNLIKRNIQDFTRKRISLGTYEHINQEVRMFSYKLFDKTNAVNSKASDYKFLINNYVSYLLKPEEIEYICKDLENTEQKILDYENIYLKSIEDIFKNDLYEEKLKEPYNFLKYGYYTSDKKIEKTNEIEPGKWYNNGYKQYAISFPQYYPALMVINKPKITIDKSITVFVKDINDNIIKQLKDNNINYIVYEDLVTSLKENKTFYSLIIDGHDTIITESLDKAFITKFKETLKFYDLDDNNRFLFAGLPFNLDYNYIYELYGKGVNPYPNFGFVFGETEVLIKIAEKMSNMKECDNLSAKYVAAIKELDGINVNVDSENILFSTALNLVHAIYEKDNSIFIKPEEMNLEHGLIFMGVK